MATVGVPGQWKFVFEVGPEGIDEGGRIFFQVPPFWGWSTPQVLWPDRLGYTTVGTAVLMVVDLDLVTIDQGLLSIEVQNQPLVRVIESESTMAPSLLERCPTPIPKVVLLFSGSRW